jgi:hypothetical protein
MAKLDHLMYAVPDLDVGMREIFELTGVAPVLGGSHPGIGTRNALLSFGDDQYLEIIAPDPQQDLPGTTGEILANNPNSGTRAWAVAADDLLAVRQAAEAVNVASRDIIDMARTTPEGIDLAWQLLFLNNARWPFFIDWQESPHPSVNAPLGCRLVEFLITTPDPEVYRQLMGRLGVEVAVEAGDLGFFATLQTPNGRVQLPSWI